MGHCFAFHNPQVYDFTCRQYFVKQVCRTYGLETYQRLTEKSDAMDFLKWTKLPDFENKEVFTSFFVILAKCLFFL